MTRKPDQSYDVPEDAPEGEMGDVIRKLIKAGVAGVPGVGGPVAELLAFLQPSVDRRTVDWLEDIAHELNRIRKRVKDVEDRDIAQDQAFVTTVLKASSVAIRTHQQEKREALRNAVLNSALRNEPNEDMQTIFLSLIERFTPWHLRILDLFNDPKAWFKRDGREGEVTSGARAVLEKAYPELRGQKEFYSQLVDDMAGDGLMQGGFLNTLMTADGAMSSRTTAWGKRFLSFVASPPDETG